VQTCRGSHTHTVVTDPNDDENVYVYVSGTSQPRPGEEMEGCTGPGSEEHPETSFFLIEVIQVPLAAPHEARIVNEPRVFADAETGDIPDSGRVAITARGRRLRGGRSSATTSRRTPRSGWPPAPARATASSWTSPIP
jgi:hypothetical protein